MTSTISHYFFTPAYPCHYIFTTTVEFWTLGHAIKSHSFLKQWYAQSSVETIWWYFQLISYGILCAIIFVSIVDPSSATPSPFGPLKDEDVIYGRILSWPRLYVLGRHQHQKLQLFCNTFITVCKNSLWRLFGKRWPKWKKKPSQSGGCCKAMAPRP